MKSNSEEPCRGGGGGALGKKGINLLIHGGVWSEAQGGEGVGRSQYGAYVSQLWTERERCTLRSVTPTALCPKERAFTAILAGELTCFFMKSEGMQEKTIVTADCCYFNPLLRRIVRFLGVYSFGLFTTTIFANAGQVVTGNPTPHFLSACRPNYTALGCQSGMQYITERRACTGNPFIVASARKSFPSKDAALSIYSAVYTVVGAP
ncbi:hypothetical protein Z043_111513 [Scleropages formosus]|uniref:Uncharacterized protein n=1 Tax=Scleropages formosus TaxID=113540 RepID=A0A0N8JZM0_SCLFO|nr:hypothetical protein Z043_111513 [Scleropages formosus]